MEANSGAVKRVGRSDAYATEFDLEADEYVPMPKGDVHKKKEIVQDVTLHDLDMSNAKPQGGQGMLSWLNPSLCIIIIVVVIIIIIIIVIVISCCLTITHLSKHFRFVEHGGSISKTEKNRSHRKAADRDQPRG